MLRCFLLAYSLSLCVFAVGFSQAAFGQNEIAAFEEVFENVTFNFPLGIRFPDDGTNKVYIAEWGGRVKVVDNDPDVASASVFLDISERIASPGGLLAIEFHPDYAENGYFFARYTLEAPERIVLSRFSRSAEDPFVADVDSEVILLEIETPGNVHNHHGGDIAFGLDGYLYVPLGDGGVLYDAVGNAQDRTKLLGKVLRLDVDNPSNGLNYGIPPDNPFVGNEKGWREEVFAYGLRNPWRLTIDRLTGEVWVGNVGEVTWEEVELIEAGQNYGWPIMEGPVCAPFNRRPCDETGLTPPVWAYSHEQGVSITGGYVYRGEAIPALRGQYVFADFASFKVWHVSRSNRSGAELLLPDQFNVTTFGEDLDGELYFNYFLNGRIFKITPGPGTTSAEGDPTDDGLLTLAVFPNPATGSAQAYFESEAGEVRLSVYDMLGREVLTLVDERVGPGTRRTVPINTGRLASGLYLVRFEGHGEHEVKRLVVAH
ncbi:MAG: PQQ-dependent sugar dehydrogenase [Rhodothermales bacterium]